jgi:hypothetical protein
LIDSEDACSCNFFRNETIFSRGLSVEIPFPSETFPQKEENDFWITVVNLFPLPGVMQVCIYRFHGLNNPIQNLPLLFSGYFAEEF